MTVKELSHEFTAYGAARDFFHCRDREVLLVGAAGTGKSRAALEKLLMLMLLNPGARGLIIRKTLVSLGTTALATWRKFVIPELLASGGVEFYGGGPEEPPGYRFSNGSFVGIGGMDRPMKVMSSEWDVIYCMEATELTIDDWEALLSRLRNWVISFQQIMADCNPSYPTHWLKARGDRGAVNMLTSRHRDNPMLFDQVSGVATEKGRAYLDILASLTGVRRARLLDGLWAAADGLIYENFDPEINIVDKLSAFDRDGNSATEPPAHWTRWWSVDFGHTNPFVCQFWAEDEDGRAYLYREIYWTRRLVEDHAKEILSVVTKCVLEGVEGHDKCEWRPFERGFCRTEWIEPRPMGIVCDHDAEDRATLEKYLGMSTTPAHKSKTKGIQAVDARWRKAGDGKPRLFFCRDALVKRDPDLEGRKLPTCSIEEIPAYTWAKTPAGDAKEEPLDKDNHGMDACRYYVAERDLGDRPGIRVLRSKRPAGVW